MERHPLEPALPCRLQQELTGLRSARRGNYRITGRCEQGRNGYARDMADASMGSPEKNPEDWTTGDEPMTGPQRSYLETLAREAGEDVPADLTKAQASELIDRLQQKTGRGR